jgi:hypothetical protein
VLLATAASHADLTSDDRLFAAALARRGAVARAAVWNDPAVDWRVQSVVVRSTWDYYRHPDEFLAWAARVAEGALLQNALPVISWNAHKEYLTRLHANGISIIETVFIPARRSVDLVVLARERGWGDVVIKPAVSAAAYETQRFDARDRIPAQIHLDRLVSTADVMVQPYIPRLSEQGELSVIFIGGDVSHAVRRRSAFARDERMPRTVLEAAPPAAIRFAERVLGVAMTQIAVTSLSGPLLYARVDLAEQDQGNWLLLELELIEPSLFFTHAPAAAERMADLLLKAL